MLTKRTSYNIIELDLLRDTFLQDSSIGMLASINYLASFRLALNAVHGGIHASWRSIIDLARQHPVCEIIHRDPFIHRAYHKPRGYAGDAEMLDMMYDRQPPDGWPMDCVAEGIFSFGMESPAPVAVRDRREHLAETIQNAIDTGRGRILSVACGHMRELDLVEGHSRGSFTCLDQDALSLEKVKSTHGGDHIQCLPLSVKQILNGKHSLGSFDLIYTAGLYDYFSQPLACRVTKCLFDLLEPGGKLLLANFSPEIRDIAFMECFMDWWLIYRSESEMQKLTSEIDPLQIASSTTYARSQGSVWYLAIKKVTHSATDPRARNA